MNLNKLNEMPELKHDKIRFNPDSEVCAKTSELIRDYPSLIYDKNNTIYKIEQGNKIIFYLVDNDIFKIIGKLEVSKVKKRFVHTNFIYQEESIDICADYRQQSFGTNFYYALLESGVVLISDYKHYLGTQGLWKKLSKKKDVIINIIKDNEIVEEDYDLLKDELNVWSSNVYLILASTKTILEKLEFSKHLVILD